MYVHRLGLYYNLISLNNYDRYYKQSKLNKPDEIIMYVKSNLTNQCSMKSYGYKKFLITSVTTKYYKFINEVKLGTPIESIPIDKEKP